MLISTLLKHHHPPPACFMQGMALPGAMLAALAVPLPRGAETCCGARWRGQARPGAGATGATGDRRGTARLRHGAPRLHGGAGCRWQPRARSSPDGKRAEKGSVLLKCVEL